MSAHKNRQRGIDAVPCINEVPEIDIRAWQRIGGLVAGSALTCTWYRDEKPSGSVKVSMQLKHVVLLFHLRTAGSPPRLMRQRIDLAWVACNYGMRAFFVCPECAIRKALLYAGTRGFACRQCYGLAYRSPREGKADRLMSKARKIRDRLGWTTSASAGSGLKPYAMHWRTFDRLRKAQRSLTADALRVLLKPHGSQVG